MKWTLILAALLLAGCGPRVFYCPDGEPVTVLRSVEDAYPVYANEYETRFKAGINQIDKVSSDPNITAESKSKVVKLRQDLDQERAALQEQLKTVVISLQTSPCDKDIRRQALDLQREFNNRANQIPERLKGIVNDEAAARLQSEIVKLVRFPAAIPDASKPPSLIEKMLDRLPFRLFELLMTYNEKDVMRVPKIGNALYSYMKNYYQFRQKVLKLEDSLMTRVGQMVPVQFRDAWKLYLKYVIMRFAGQSKESIIAAGDFLNYDITWDDTERVFTQLSSEPPIPHEISEVFTLHKSLIEDVSRITSAI